MTMRDVIRGNINEQKAKNKRKEITDFVHTKPCGTCGSTHGCNCHRQADDSRGNSLSSYGYGYPRD